MTKHLDFNTDFLNNNASIKKKAAGKQSPKKNPQKKSGGDNKGWIITAIIIAVLVIIGLVDDSSTSTTTTADTRTYTTTNRNGGLVDTGEFWCSSYHNRKSTEIEPAGEYQIELEQSRLEGAGDKLEVLLSKIDTSSVTEYSSQWEIDQYNQMNDEYESGFNQYDRDHDRLQVKIDKYNREVVEYNNYLITNCDPK